MDAAANRGRAKYQRGGGGGPGLHEAAGLLDAYAEDAQAELAQLVSALAFTIAVGNADAHAKNVSFLHNTGNDDQTRPALRHRPDPALAEPDRGDGDDGQRPLPAWAADPDRRR